MTEFLKSTALLLVLLNPFLLIIYLTDVVQKLDQPRFSGIVVRAGLIAVVVFAVFALLGDAIFVRIMQVEFASFQIFGGIVFLLIGLQFVFRGPTAIEILQGEYGNLAGAVAMPVFIGPGTIGASVVVGKRLDPLMACLSVVTAVAVCVLVLILLKRLHDVVVPRREALVQRYIEIGGRITALIVGTLAVDMIARGVRSWWLKF
jgi:multiple antibiotic resistance protein